VKNVASRVKFTPRSWRSATGPPSFAGKVKITPNGRLFLDAVCRRVVKPLAAGRDSARDNRNIYCPWILAFFFNSGRCVESDKILRFWRIIAIFSPHCQATCKTFNRQARPRK